MPVLQSANVAESGLSIGSQLPRAPAVKYTGQRMGPSGTVWSNNNRDWCIGVGRWEGGGGQSGVCHSVRLLWLREHITFLVLHARLDAIM